MSEIRMVSPLLDDMIVEKERIGHNGQTYHTLRNNKTGEQFILKLISLPENDSRIRALILSGAYPDEQSVHAYYGRLVEDMKAELEIGQKLASSGCFAGTVSFQAEPKATGVGYDIYILYPMNVSLSEYLTMNAMTRLRALNLGIDLCDSIAACREAGYLFQNIQPDNIFLMPSGRFLLGGLGLTALEYIEYAGVPEEYLGAYSAPELSDITACPNLTIDLYALGMVLYRIYNGNHGPFEDESTNAAMAEKLRMSGKPLPSPIYADYELAEIILKACTFKKEERYQNPDELKQALMLYMQRNAVSDDLVAPPIIADLDPVPLIDEPIEEEPIRMTDAKDLDEDFRQNFAPDLSGSGDDIKEKEDSPQPVTVPAEVTDEIPQEPIELEETDNPDQLDLDALLASISAEVNEKPIEETASDKKQNSLHPQAVEKSQNSLAKEVRHDYVDAAHDESDEKDDVTEVEEHKRPKIILWVTISALLAGIALLGYFLLNWYFIDVTELKTVYTTPTQIMVELVTDDDPKYFTVTCTDFFGNVYEGLRSGKQYCFTDLRENTSYTISVAAAKNHEFSTAAPSLTETTNEYTKISDISFDRDDTIDGSVCVSFKHTGPVPAQWKITYSKKGDANSSVSESFDGESFQVSGLELYETYVFTIEDAGGVYVVGENTAEYRVLPIIQVNNFVINNIVGNVVSLEWEYEGTAPEKWGLLCTAEGMEDISITTTDTAAEITVPDFTKSYTFYLNAMGLDEPMQLALDVSTIVVNNLTAQPNENGEIIVTWDTPAGEPEGGWLVNYRLKNGYYSNEGPVVSCPSEDENSVTLKYLPANALYEIELVPVVPADINVQHYGNMKVEVTTAAATPFTGYQISPAAPYGDGTELESLIALWEKPEKENWDYRDLNTSRRKTYTAGEEIAFCIQIDSCDLSTAVKNDPVHLTYAVRNENGEIVTYKVIEYMDEAAEQPLTWDGVWFDRRHTGTVPIPYSPAEVDENGNPVVMVGNFTVEIYINGKLLAAKGFVIEA